MLTFLNHALALLEKFNQRIAEGSFAITINLWRRFRLFLRRAKRNLKRCARALRHLIIAFLKLSFFYLPALLAWLAEWNSLALLCLLAVTAVGLFYRQNLGRTHRNRRRAV